MVSGDQPFTCRGVRLIYRTSNYSGRYFPCPWATYYPCLGSHPRHRRPFGLGASAALPWMAFHHHQACLAYPAFVACHQCRVCQARSEEHTSELQSRFDLVCRLLLEKKKRLYILLSITYHLHHSKS